MEIRKGDVLRLKPVTVDSVYSDGTFDIDETYLCEGTTYFHLDMVEEIISRIETPEETKERLESEVSFWKASAEAYNAEVIRLQNLLTGVSDEQK
jgi:hypothetical protein